MRYNERVPKALFEKNGHFKGRPADFNDRIVMRRVRLVKQITNFIGKDLSLLDIGCGNGASMFLLSNEMKKCVGVEINEDHKEEFYNYKERNSIENCDFKN